VRASLGIYNDDADVAALLAAVRALAARAPDTGYAWKGDTETWSAVPR
jgi:hypothetical protein